MDVTRPTHHYAQKASFHLLTPDQIRRLSVKAINNPEVFDNLNHPVRGGLYDPSLGPVDKNGRCATCGLSAFQCPGHFGHIELAVPVYAPLTFAHMFQLLRQCCLYCHRFRSGAIKTQLCISKLMLLDAGLLNEAKDVDAIIFQRSSLDEETEKLDVETVCSKIRVHTNKLLLSSPASTTKSSYPSVLQKQKNGPISSYRATVIADFTKLPTASNLCQHCRGHIPALYRHAGTKIFINPLRKSHQLLMDSKGMDTEKHFKSNNTNTTAIEQDQDDGQELQTPNDAVTKGMKFLTPMHVFEHIRQLWKNESQLLNLMFGSQLYKKAPGASGKKGEKSTSCTDHRIFFTEVIAVPPCRFRPPSVLLGSQFDHPQNTYLIEIIKLNAKLVELSSSSSSSPTTTNAVDTNETGFSLSGSSNGGGKKGLDKMKMEKSDVFAELIKTWVYLQEQVNYLFDSSKNINAPGSGAPPGIKQILEKKEGLFRKHMMGKRVNYAARSVISPDPNLETSEIGVPMVFAKRLTYPEPVTEYNEAELRRAVINGPEEHPGAAYVQMEDGTLANLELMSKPARFALANQLRTPSSSSSSSSSLVSNANDNGAIGEGLAVKKVMRHIKNGDIVLMNRQPTLHKPSIMAHRVRVLPGEKTLRMHYANCNTYNADFDGDEMNMHFPQSELARAEAYHIANTNNQYLVPTDGSPLRGLIQDHIVSGVLLSLKDSWLTRETYQQLLWGSLPETSDQVLLTIPPAILKPQPLWSGKQIFSSVLLNLSHGRPQINLTANCKINTKLWGKSHADEAVVIIQNGYLCTGVMDKSQFGASSYGITHAVYELYGADAAGSLLTTIGRLLTKYDQYIGFTCRMDDLLLDDAANQRRRTLIESSHIIGKQVVTEYAKLDDNDDGGDDDDDDENDKEIGNVRGAIEKIIRSEELSRGLDGAMKGQMNGLTGKIIETCLPSGQLRPFPLNNMSLMTNSGAKGSMVNFSQISGLLGQQELEGRRVPVMVSGKTLPSFPAFDPRARAGGYITQRFLTGIRPQEFFFHCMAGREGLIDTAVKTSRSGYLQRCLIKHLESLKVQYDGSVRDCDGSILQFQYGEDGLDVIKQKYLDHYEFSARNFDLLTAQCRPEVVLERVNTVAAVKASKKAIKKPTKYEPALSIYPPTVYLGSVSEKYWMELEKFIKTTETRRDSQIASNNNVNTIISKNPLDGLDVTQFRAVMWLRYMRSLVEAGEAVGLLAAQSVGEPSTQMTLNTFHFAGFGAKNVTLGIPRLREIIMTASQRIKTPSITIPVLADSQMNAEELAKSMSKLTMKQIVKNISVEERLIRSTSLIDGAAVNLGKRAKVYTVQIDFIPLDECKENFKVTSDEVQDAIENGLVRVMLAAIEKALKRARASGNSLISTATIKEKAVNSNVNNEEAIEESRDSTKVNDLESESDDDGANGGISPNQDDDDDAKANLRKQAVKQDDDSEDSDIEDSPTMMDVCDIADVNNNSDAEDIDNDGKESIKLGTASVVDDKQTVSSSSFASLSSSSSVVITDAKKESVLAQTRFIRNYRYDQENNSITMELIFSASQPKLLLLDLLERHIGDVVIRQVPGIGRIFAQTEETSISTEGANLRGIWEHPLANHLDLRRLYTNDIHAVLQRYGVEAARATIVKEIASVFAVYGISVDVRHLYLIADYMTVNGGYRPFNRGGMASSPSPLLQMTFETTVGFLRQAALVGDWDDLTSPSSRLVVGLPVSLGTAGSFEIRQSLSV